MLPPFDDLPNCEEVKYSMQLSLYRLIIERNTNLRLSGGHILHLPSDSEYVLYNTLDLRTRLEAWLKGAIADGTFGDPEVEKQSAKVVKSLDQFDLRTLTMMSPPSRSKLCHKVNELKTMLDKFI